MLPSTAQWQAQLDALSVGLRLDSEIEPHEHSGYWPADLAGTSSGFEFYTGSLAEAFPHLPPAGVDGRNLVANFVTHSDVGELQCAMFAAAALATSAKGLVFDEDTGGVMSGMALLDQARSVRG